LIDPRTATAEVHLPGLDVTAPIASGPFVPRARGLHTRTTIVVAELASRLGRDDEARRYSDEARARCPTCIHVVTVSAVIAARRGDYSAGNRMLDDLARLEGEPALASVRKRLQTAELASKQAAMSSGPIALQLRANELAELEAYGRAYELLAPHRAQIEQAPGLAIGFAELAYRAGEETVAREVLAAQVPPEKIAPMFAEWARKMGWQ
jgi:hypothetical protein